MLTSHDNNLHILEFRIPMTCFGIEGNVVGICMHESHGNS